MSRLAGKRALVTAAGQGIGRAIYQAFVANGATVIAADRDAGLLDGPGDAVVIDLTDRAALAQLRERTGPIDILVNAAGMVTAGDALECSQADFDASLDLNVGVMFRLIRLYLPDMAAARSGSIVNIASVASSIIGVPNRFAYSVSKAAVIGLTKSVAADFVAMGVRCNAICPGTVESPSLLARVHEQAARDGKAFEQTLAGFAQRQPLGRLGRPEEIAAMAVHLASDESAFTTGTTAIVDGGWSLL